MKKIDKFIKEQARYAFGKARRDVEIEIFCKNFGYANVMLDMPLDWVPSRVRTGLTLQDLVHAWLLHSIEELRNRAKEYVTGDVREEKDEYYVQDVRHTIGNCVQWAAMDDEYVTNLTRAGVFTRAEAEKICEGKHHSFIAWPKMYVDEQASLQVNSERLFLDSALYWGEAEQSKGAKQ